MNIINKCFHRSNAINFFILDEALFNNIAKLIQNVIRNLLGLTNDALQHLKIQ
jgi:hypothetical protein